MTIGFLLRRIDCNDGVASHLETLIRGLTAAGAKVVLLTGPIHRRDVAAARYESLALLAENWVILDLPIDRRPVNFHAVHQLSQAINNLGIQLLHLHGVSTLPLARLAVRRKNIPIVATAHPSGTSVRGPGKVAKRIIRVTRPALRRWYLPDRAIAISTDLEDWFTNDLCIKPRHVHRIFHGVDAQHFRPPSALERTESRRYFGLSESAVVVSLLGRYEPVKRHDILISAVRQLAHICADIRVVLVGAGSYESSIRMMVDDSGIGDRIHLHGPISDARTVYWASDIVVLPSDREGFGLAVAEAMLCGVVPVRTATAGAFDQIQQGEDGYVFPIGQTAELERILLKLYDNPELRKKMGLAAARSAREKFDSSVMAARTLAVYRSLVNDEEIEFSDSPAEAVVAERR